MKALSEKVCGNASNAWGRTVYSCHQTFEVEAQDAGPRDNYLGHRHRVEKVAVGDRIVVYTDNSNWTCWVFDQQSAERRYG